MTDQQQNNAAPIIYFVISREHRRDVSEQIGRIVLSVLGTPSQRIERAGAKDAHVNPMTADEITTWLRPCRQLVIAGDEPMATDLRPVIRAVLADGGQVRIETPGTVWPTWLGRSQPAEPLPLAIDGLPTSLSVTVQPTPGYLDAMIELATEVVVRVGGDADGPGWPTLLTAVRWAEIGKRVALLPADETAKRACDMVRLTSTVVFEVREIPR